jgi:NAD(P)-dependent dehydrogenase (short-subunit alcohol dehydrogenase family)
VVNIASEGGLRGVNGLDAYTASKGAMIAMTRSVASYYGRYDVRCNALALGFVNSGGDRIQQLLRQPGFSEAIMQHHLGVMGTPEHVAPAAVYLLSGESAYLSGAIIPLDGGAAAASHSPRPNVPDLPGVPRLRPGAPLI